VTRFPSALVVGFAIAAILTPCVAWAQGLDLSKGGAIDVTSQDGMEWRQNEQMVIANGNARAVRGAVTVTADRLIARYRRKAPSSSVGGATAPSATSIASAPGSTDTGSNEIYRLEAEGNVRIFTATDLAVGDKAVYDIDQAVLLMTGTALTITTPQQVMTARDTMEYWSQKHMAVGRGNATVTTSDGRRVTGDTLVGFTQAPASSGGSNAAKPVAQSPAPGKAGADPLGASGKLQRVEGFGNVEVRTATEVVRGDRGVYVADSGIARLAGHVRIIRGQNYLDGDEALVNMRTGISTLVRDKPGQRVQGLVVPNDASAAATPVAPANAPKLPREIRSSTPSSTR